jgi:hypothetical protein
MRRRQGSPRGGAKNFDLQMQNAGPVMDGAIDMELPHWAVVLRRVGNAAHDPVTNKPIGEHGSVEPIVEKLLKDAGIHEGEEYTLMVIGKQRRL